jgi:hypothetical protein
MRDIEMVEVDPGDDSLILAAVPLILNLVVPMVGGFRDGERGAARRDTYNSLARMANALRAEGGVYPNRWIAETPEKAVERAIASAMAFGRGWYAPGDIADRVIATRNTEILATRAARVTELGALAPYTDEELLALPLEADPGPGFWDENLDFRTDITSRPGGVVSARGRKFRVRTDATGRCPSGPCGSRKTVHRIA